MGYIKDYCLYIYTEDDDRLYRPIADGVVYDENSLEAKIIAIKTAMARGLHPIVAIFVPEDRPSRRNFIPEEERGWFRPEAFKVILEPSGMVTLDQEGDDDFLSDEVEDE